MAWEWFTQELIIGVPSRNTDYNLSGTDESNLSNLANVWGSGDIYTSEGNTVKNNTVTVGNATLTINVGSTSSGVDFQFDIAEGEIVKYSHHVSGLNHNYFYDKPQGIGFIVDTTLQRALTAYVYQSNRSGDTRSYVNVNGTIIAEQQEYLYQFLQGLLPQQYTWTSVPAISGKNGILSLSMIKNEALGDGSPIINGNLNDIERLAAGSNIRTLASNIGVNEQSTICYSGENYRLDLARSTKTITLPGPISVTISTAILKFYMLPTTGGAENLIYTSPEFSFGANSAAGYSEADSYIGIITDDENEVAALNIIVPKETVVDYNDPGATMSAEDMHLLWLWLRPGNPDEDEDPLDSFEDNEGDGGGDLINRPNNPIPTPGVCGMSAYDTGFVSQWLIGKTALKDLASFLWSDDFVENLSKFFNDPRQIIQGIVISDVLPLDYDTNPSTIKAGGISTGVSGNRLNKQFERYDMGRLTLDKRLKTDNKKGGIYFDYSPFTALKIYLPYCGEHQLNPDDCIGNTLELSYTVDHLSGVCCAHLTIKGSEDECHYNFTGQMGVQIPLSSEDYGGFYRALLSAGAAVGGALATTAAGGMTAPLAVGSAANAISNIANMGRDVSYTSGGGSISGELSSEYPYITIEEPDPFMATNQKHYTGYPCYSTYKLKEMSGYTKVMGIHLDGLSCTESEREIIRAQLSKGVIIQTGDELPTPSSGDELCKIMLLTNLSDVDTIGKKFYKSNGEVAYIEIKSDLVYNQNYTRVGLLIDQFDASCNYVYIPSFGRCYYVDSVTVESGAMSRLDLVVDASESFWHELKECEALIETTQQKSKAKLLVNNNTWFMPQKKNIKTLTFKDDTGHAAHFSRTPVDSGGKQCFLITIAGDTNNATP